MCSTDTTTTTTNSANLGLTDVSASSGSDSSCGAGCMCGSSAASAASNDTASNDTASKADAAPAAPAASATEEFLVTGMTCGHCVSSVTEELSELEGVDSVEVELNAGGASRVSVSASRPLDEATVRAAVAEAGYELVSAAQ